MSNQKKHKLIQNIAKIGWWKYRSEGKVVKLSAEICKIFGLDSDREVTSLNKLLSYINEAKELESAIADAIAHHSGFEIDLTVTVGAIKKYIKVIAFQHGADFRGTAQDITNQKELMEQINHSKEELERLNLELKNRFEETVSEMKLKEQVMFQQAKLAAMGEMIEAIAHQWQQPLNAISTATINISLKKDFNLLTDEKLREILGEIENQTQKMSQTIHDFLNFFKPHKDYEVFNLKSCVNSLINLLKTQLKNSKIEIINTIDERVEVVGVRNLLEHVLLNLIVNAKDAYLSIDKIEKIIKIGVENRVDEVLLFVEDKAGGVDEEIFTNIFEPYFTTKKKGSGIGLYMSKMILQRSFNGDISAENIYEDGKRVGVRFIITVKRDIENAN